MEVQLDTTQQFTHNAQFMTGSLSMVEVELKDPKHKYWTGEVTNGAGAKLIKGVTYTVKTPNSAGTATAVGAAAATMVAGETFVADDGVETNKEGTEITFEAYTSAVVSYDNGDEGLRTVVYAVQMRGSIVYIGVADNKDKDGNAVTGSAGASKVRLILENSNHEDYARANDRAVPSGWDSKQATGAADELERALRVADGQTPTDDSKWVVEHFVI